jgi:phospholipase C
MGGFVAYETSLGHDKLEYCNVMNGFAPKELPVINALAEEYAVMDRFFASHPGPTWPNRMFSLSATSAGSTETYAWYRDQDGELFPQMTIFDQVEAAGLTWKNYYNDTPWVSMLTSNFSCLAQIYFI